VIDDALIGLLAVGAFAWSLAPLRSGPIRIRPARDRLVEEAQARKAAAVAGIVDLEEEHALGKLAEPDLQALKADYEAEALLALRELDALKRVDDDSLEAEIARVRAELACPSCGALRLPGKDCPSCGA
jgi:rubrerythrin